MANIQQQFEQFHTNIRTYYEINKELQEKKDIIVKRVKDQLKAKGLPGVDVFLQGSYKMKVGICPLPGTEFDIDVGLRFSISPSEYTATEVRRWVFEAVVGHTETVEEKGPCIRVIYAKGYHVDLVCYSWFDDQSGIEQYRLAHKTNGWRPADPPRLVEHVVKARRPFEGTEDAATGTDQFRRVVRYLKRWNDIAIKGESNDKPTGLALVLLTEQHLTSPARFWDGESDDLGAVARVARAASVTLGRIIARKPTPEGEDMFARLSADAMSKLKTRFGLLADALANAEREVDPHAACKQLAALFGNDFPVPDPSESGRRSSGPAVITSSSSG